MSKLKLQAAASVTPVGAMGCTHARRPVPQGPKAKTAAEMMRKLKLQRRRTHAPTSRNFHDERHNPTKVTKQHWVY
jgi:hypothetical protein